MSNELIKKAWDHFGGVWPDDADVIAVYVTGKIQFFYDRKYVIGDNGWTVLFENKQQFEAYGASLEKEWTPEKGVEYEFSCSAKGKETEWTIGRVEYLSDYTCVMKSPLITGEFVAHPDTMKFRPIKTEREKFIDQVIDDYLVQVGSDAVNLEWYGRIFGAMYDARYRENET